MTNFNDADLLEMVELWAEDANRFSNASLIESEAMLSERFDAMIEDLDTPQSTIDDGPMMREWFNNWTDGLCKEGELHPEQYQHYCYVGELDID